MRESLSMLCVSVCVSALVCVRVSRADNRLLMSPSQRHQSKSSECPSRSCHVVVVDLTEKQRQVHGMHVVFAYACRSQAPRRAAAKIDNAAAAAMRSLLAGAYYRALVVLFLPSPPSFLSNRPSVRVMVHHPSLLRRWMAALASPRHESLVVSRHHLLLTGWLR